MTESLLNERKGVLYVAIAALLWSSGGIGIKGIADSAVKVACYRSLVAAIVLFLIFRPKTQKISILFIASVISYAGCLITFVTATKWTTAANAIFLQYGGIVWVLLLSPLFLREKLVKRDVIAVVVALSGMGLFFVNQFEARGLAGNIMAVISSMFFAGLVMTLRKQRGAVAEAVVTWGNVLVFVALIAFIPDGYGVTPKSAAVLVFLGVSQIGIAYAFFVGGIKYITATEASLTGMIEPIANPIWVFLLLAERPDAFAILGAIVVLAAIGWRTIGSSEPADPIEAPS